MFVLLCRHFIFLTSYKYIYILQQEQIATVLAIALFGQLERSIISSNAKLTARTSSFGAISARSSTLHTRVTCNGENYKEMQDNELKI